MCVFLLYIVFDSFQIISEEEVSESKCGSLAFQKVAMESPFEMDSLVDEEIPVRDLTVWIDPLDATQEFTG